jgi:hypothetical protein
MLVRRGSTLFIAAVVLQCAACGGSKAPTAPTNPTTATVTAVTIGGGTQNSDGSVQLTATAALSDGTSRLVTLEATWASSDTTVATVDKGRVTPVGVGEAEISAVYQNVTGRVRITVSNVACMYSVSPTTISVPAGGGTASVNVSTGAECTWTASAGQSFVSIVGSGAGSGPGVVSFTVPANAFGGVRTATLTVAGRSVSITQAQGDCVSAVSPSIADFSAELRRGTLTVTAAAGCSWTPTSPSWISLFPDTPRTGNAFFTYRVFGNLTGAPRSGAIQVGSKTATFSQHAATGAGNYFSFVSDTGDGIGQGWTVLHETPTSTITPIAQTGPEPTRTARLNIVGSDGVGTLNWILTLVAPQGQVLAPGTYLNATRWPFQEPTVPGLDFSGDGRGCNTLSGQFTISAITFGAGNQLDRLQATFEQHCNGMGPALRGTIFYVR